MNIVYNTPDIYAIYTELIASLADQSPALLTRLAQSVSLKRFFDKFVLLTFSLSIMAM